MRARDDRGGIAVDGEASIVQQPSPEPSDDAGPVLAPPEAGGASERDAPQPQSLLARRAAVWGMVALVILGFGRICSNDFTWWDDNLTIHHNPRLDPPTFRDTLYFWTHREESMYVPVTYTAWALIGIVAWQAQPGPLGATMRPWPYHFASLMAHLATALLVFTILLRLFGRRWAAFAGAAFYAMHPVQVETVAWATSLKEGLCGLFVMLSIWYYLRAIDRREGQPPFSDTARRLMLLVSALAMALGQLSNPMAVVTPLICFALDCWIIGRPLGKAARTAGALLLAASIDAIITRLAQPGLAAPHVPFWARPLIATDTLAFYLYKLLIPLRLCTDYARRPDLALASGWVWWTWIFTAAAAGGVAYAGRRRRWAWAAGTIFVAGVAPVLGFVPFDLQQYSTPADRYLYVSMLGPALALAACFATPRRLAAKGALLAVIGLLTIQTAVQCGVWRNDQSLWAWTTAVSPRSFVAQSNYGAYYDRQAGLEPVRAIFYLNQAIAHYRRSIDINPDFMKGRENLTSALLRVGQVDQAIVELTELVRREDQRPVNQSNSRAVTRQSLGDLLLSRNRPREALVYLEAARRLDPTLRGLDQSLAEAAKRCRQ